MNPNELIAALALEAAPSDAVRASVLGALAKYGNAVGNVELAEAANAAMPKAHPFTPPVEWRKSYEDGFRCIADYDKGVDPDESYRYSIEYWQRYLTDEGRALRLQCPSMGRADGEKDADALNEA